MSYYDAKDYENRELLQTEPIAPLDFPAAEAMSCSQPKTYLDHLETLAKSDADSLRRSERNYGDSWKRRGGIGAFMMLARKWDRIENAMKGPTICGDTPDSYDIFNRIRLDTRAEGLIDDIRDLRRYLLLVEAEMSAQGHKRNEVVK